MCLSHWRYLLLRLLLLMLMLLLQCERHHIGGQRRSLREHERTNRHGDLHILLVVVGVCVEVGDELACGRHRLEMVLRCGIHKMMAATASTLP